ncbi:MAG: hypothetical protein GY810_03800 [Aureispira sp.]|nr:hypothetical protein [Aureispira sp.]
MKIVLIISFFWLVWSISLIAQQPYTWQLTDRDGLPSMEVYDLYQDRKGAIWIGTDAGFCRYNGQTIKSYSHPKQKGTSASRISEDREGRIWYQNFNGQLFFVEEDSLQLFQAHKEKSFYTYFFHAQDTNQNLLWIADKDSLRNYNLSDRTQKVTLLPCDSIGLRNNRATNLHYWAPNRLLFVNSLQELWTKDASQEKSWGKGDKDVWCSAFPYSSDSIILYDVDNIYIDVLDSIMELKTSAKLANIKAQIYKVFVDRDKNIWAGTSEGVYFWLKKPDGGFEEAQLFLAKQQVSSFCQDREGNYWFGTLRNGVFIIPHLNMQYYDAANSSLLNGQVNKLVKVDEYNLLLGLSNGTVANLETNTKQIVHYKGNAPNNNVTGLLYDPYRKQILFFARRLFIFDWDKKQEEESYSHHTGFHQGIIYKKNDLILGTNSGASWQKLYPKIAQDTLPPQTLELADLINKETSISDSVTYYRYWIRRQRVNALWADYTADNKFWVGYDDSLFYYIDGQAFSVLTAENNPVNSLDISQDKEGTVWVGTVNNGIYGIVNNRIQYHYTTKNGLPSNLCRTLAVDGQNLWVGTNKGIFNLNLETDQISLYNELDGLVSEEIRDIEVANGRIWAATTRGLISFDKELLANNLTPPLLSLKAIKVNNKIHPLQSSFQLGHEQTNLKFYFEGLAFRARGNYVYEYRLLGLDSLWVEPPGYTNFIQFERLNSGHYNLEIRIKNEDGIVSTQNIKISFTIAQPYWETWWFRGLAYLIAILVIVTFVRWRYQIAQKRQNQENMINELRGQALQSQMNPHFVFNAMSAIQGYWMQKQPEIALNYHAKFAKLMRLIFDYSKELAIHIEAEIEFLEVYVALEQMRFEDQVECCFEVEEALREQEIYIPPLLIQPIVENSFKHGFLHKKGKGRLLISLKKQGNYVYCKVADDGVGRRMTQQKKAWRKDKQKERSSTDVVIERLAILNKTYGANPNQVTFKVTDLTASDGQASGTQTEMWIPLK